MIRAHLISTLSLLCVAVPVNAATRYVSTAGADSNACTQAAPCLSLGRAYNVAAGGDVIEVAAGTYGPQTIPTRALGTSVVIFRPANGATVTLSSLAIQASYVEIQNMNATGYSIAPASSSSLPSAVNHVTLRNMTGKYMYILGEDIAVIGGDYGGFDACDTKYPEDVIQIWQNYPDGKASSRVIFDGVTVHDVTDHNNICDGTPGAGRHVDCMQVLAGHNITVRNSQFYNCATSNILMRPYKDTLDNITIENNFFQGVMNPGNVVLIGDSTDTVGGTNVIRYNYVPVVGVAARYTGSMHVYGNIISTNYQCYGATWAYNVFMGSSTACGTNYVKGNPSFVGPTPNPSYLNGIKPNYRLAAGDTVAKDRADPARYPATDIDGGTRYTGAAPDIGASEIESTVAGGLSPPTKLKFVP